MVAGIPATQQLAVFVALPLSLFILILVVVCCCYWKEALCFAKKREDSLLLPAQRKRYTVDLSKRGRRNSAAESDSSSIGKPDDVKELNGGLRYQPYIPIAPPEFTRSVPVGQATYPSKSVNISCYPQPIKRFSSSLQSASPANKRASQDLSQHTNAFEHHEESRFEEAEDENHSHCYVKPVVSIHLNSEKITQPENLTTPERNLATISEVQSDRLSPNTFLSPNLNTDSDNESMNREEQNGNSRRTSFDLQMFHHSGSASTIMEHDRRHSITTDVENNSRRGSLVSYGSIHTGSTNILTSSRESIAATSRPPDRRRSSMQMPIDLRQIDPRLYQQVEKLRAPSIDSEDEDDAGMINFYLRYEEETEVFSVKLIQAKNLSIQDITGIMDPYCTVAILPGFTPRKSKVRKRTCDPEFDETFVFSVSPTAIKELTLQIKSFHHDQFSRDECNGIMEFELERIDFGTTPFMEMWRKFKKPTNGERPNNAEGDVMLMLSYLRSAEKLTVAIQKARNICLPEAKKTRTDSYVKVCLYKGKQRLKKKKTTTVSAIGNPVFNQALTFNVPLDVLQGADTRLVCTIVDEYKLGYNLDIGKVELGKNCEDPEAKSHWLEMLSQPANKMIARWHALEAPAISILSRGSEHHETLPQYARRKSLAVLESLRPHSSSRNSLS